MVKEKMTLYHEYLDLQEQYIQKYGAKSIVLMQVGSFYEAYQTPKRGYNLDKLSDLLNVIVTLKNKKKEYNITNPRMLGFPTVSIFKFVRMLVNLGYTVITYDQRDVGRKKMERFLSGIYSSGTYLDIDDDRNPNSRYLMSIFLEEEKQFDKKTLLCAGLSTIDLTTGQSLVHDVCSLPQDKDLALDEISRFINSYQPIEVILDHHQIESNDFKLNEFLHRVGLDSDKVRIMNNYQDDDDKRKKYQKISYQNQFLKTLYPESGKSMLSPIEYLDLEKKSFGRISLIALLDFAKDHKSDIIQGLPHPQTYWQQKYLFLGNNAITQLNIIPPNITHFSFDTVYGVINHCRTAMGKRYLLNTLVSPLIEKKDIQNRYQAIGALMGKENTEFRKQLRQKLGTIRDIERFHRKMCLGSLNPQELYVLAENYHSILEIYGKISKLSEFKYFKLSSETKSEVKHLMKRLKEDFYFEELQKYNLKDLIPNYFDKKEKGNNIAAFKFFRPGKYPEIDEYQKQIVKSTDTLEVIAESLSQYLDETGNFFIPGKGEGEGKPLPIKPQNTTKDGQFLKITKRRYKSLQDNVGNKKLTIDTLGIIFTLDELRMEPVSAKSNDLKLFLPDKFGLQSETQNQKEKMDMPELIDKLLREVKKNYLATIKEYYQDHQTHLFQLVSFISHLDFIVNGAHVADSYKYCQPIIKKREAKDSYIQAKNLRHPIIEQIIDEEYIPNDVFLGCEGENKNQLDGMMLFGLNSAGKSSYMKSIGIAVIMAQIGYYVPAKKFTYYPFTSLFTRISGSDDIVRGLSSFAVEMTELRNILKRVASDEMEEKGQCSLVLCDEISKGTEHESSKVIVLAMIKMLSQCQAKFITTTHLHEIVKSKTLESLDNVDCYHLHVDYDEGKNLLIFDRKLRYGNGKTEYGLDVAKCIIDNPEFFTLSKSIKKELFLEKEIVSSKSSHFNSQVYLTQCAICERRQEHLNDNLEVHHILEQCKANKDGYFKVLDKEHYHKNKKDNLVVLCREDHQKVHRGEIVINGYLKTSQGNQLDFYHVKKEDELSVSDSASESTDTSSSSSKKKDKAKDKDAKTKNKTHRKSRSKNSKSKR